MFFVSNLLSSSQAGHDASPPQPRSAVGQRAIVYGIDGKFGVSGNV